MQTLGIISQLIIAKLKGEPVFALVLRPDIKRTVTNIENMSLALAHDGVHSALRSMAMKGERINWTDEERQKFRIPHDNNYTG